MGAADLEQLFDPGADLGWHRGIVVGRIGPAGPDQDAGVERTAQDDGDTLAPAGGEKLILPALLQQSKSPWRIASSQIATSFTPMPMARIWPARFSSSKAR
jgi:hypothetical protein